MAFAVLIFSEDFGAKIALLYIFIPIFPFQHTSSENFAIELSDVLKMLFITDKGGVISEVVFNSVTSSIKRIKGIKSLTVPNLFEAEKI